MQRATVLCETSSPLDDCCLFLCVTSSLLEDCCLLQDEWLPRRPLSFLSNLFLDYAAISAQVRTAISAHNYDYQSKLLVLPSHQ